MVAKYLARAGWHVTRYPNWQVVNRCLLMPPQDCNLLGDVSEADLTVFQWFYVPGILQAAMQIRQMTRSPLLLDLDDDVFNVPEEHAAYDQFKDRTPEECYQTITAPLEAVDVLQKRGWEVKFDGQETVEARRLTIFPFRQVFTEVLKAMDGLTVTTPFLATNYGPLVDPENTHTLPNCYDPEEWAGVTQAEPTSFPSILWAGSMAHSGNLEMVRPALLKVLEQVPNCKFLIMGDVNLPVFKKFPPERLIPLGWNRLEDYPRALAATGAWVGIAPAQDNPFTRAKSHIRWMEYTLAGIPSVCSPTPEYALWAREGARFADTTEQWVEHLRTLLGSATLRADLAAGARVRVADCDIRLHIGKWMTAYTAAVVKGPKRAVPGDQRGSAQPDVSVAAGTEREPAVLAERPGC